MKLNEQALQEKAFWQAKQIALPQFDREQVIRQTRNEPTWVHFGPGNIFRAHIAMLQQSLLEHGDSDRGIIAVAPNNDEIIHKIYRPHDNLSLFVRLNLNKPADRIVVGSVAESLGSTPDSSDWQRLKEIFSSASLQIVSLTVTEKGYLLKDAKGQWLPKVEADLVQGNRMPQSFAGKLAALLQQRYCQGAVPVTMLSLDNCSHNGDVLRHMLEGFVMELQRRHGGDSGFLAYLQQHVSYPWSMIDKITPRPAESVAQQLRELGLEDMDLVKSRRGGWYSPFVNAEELEYLVVEDNFANGRPLLEKAGVIFTQRDTVDKAERMKVSTCLNPLHTALAIFGCLLGYKSIATEMQDLDLHHLVEYIGYAEGMPVVTDPGVINPRRFLSQCLTQRFPNRDIPDTPQRIACDTSQKLPVRFGNTLKAYAADEKLQAESLRAIPLVFAGWLRYLLGIDDKGQKFTVSADPLLPELQARLQNLHLRYEGPVHDYVKDILSDSSIFGCDLYKIGLGRVTEDYFQAMLAGTGRVRQILAEFHRETKKEAVA
ncbi:MAG: mannitol dehydrogenase family protein [Selenomonas sp.]|uniref:mannitol dehydrogenase family protein n=1 Tax=Selenomonas sp. TaxID=2053611 RepID=UPI0025E72BD8|nr:mannitol dehydrogenase family protein [Selenomonas sp.]MCR5757941.1 mannitol dehydrogenase family protein [Selenomonas sp.]